MKAYIVTWFRGGDATSGSPQEALYGALNSDDAVRQVKNQYPGETVYSVDEDASK